MHRTGIPVAGVTALAVAFMACGQQETASPPPKTVHERPFGERIFGSNTPQERTEQAPFRPFPRSEPQGDNWRRRQFRRALRFAQELSSPVPLKIVKVNQTVSFPVVVKNISEETWMKDGLRQSDPAHRNPVNLSYRWISGPTMKERRGEGEALAADLAEWKGRPLPHHSLARRRQMLVSEGTRTALPKDLAPGESVVLNALVQTPPSAGNFTLRLTMVKEDVAWFDERGARTLDLPVTVTTQ
jgi:hypothetical protein